MKHHGEYRQNRSGFLITQAGERTNKPTVHQHFYKGHLALGTSPLQIAKDLETDGRQRAAGIEYARQGKTTDAERCARACMAAGRTADAAAIYLVAGIPREAIRCTQDCRGDDAFRAAKLLLEHSEIKAAQGCAERYLEGKDVASIGPDDKKILLRIFCLAGDMAMANKFI